MGGWNGEGGDVPIAGRLLDEAGDPVVGIGLEDSEAGRLVPRHGDGRHGDVRARLLVEAEHLLEVHAVELVAGEDGIVGGGVVLEVHEVLAHRVRGALVPVAGLQGLLGGQQLHESPAERVEAVRAVDVLVQRRRVELGEHEDLPHAGMHASWRSGCPRAGTSPEGDGGLRALCRQRVEPLSFSAAEHDGDDLVH